MQKKRTPAWCDRVLWHTPRKELHQLAYARGELTASDHKPVAAAFLLQVSGPWATGRGACAGLGSQL